MKAKFTATVKNISTTATTQCQLFIQESVDNYWIQIRDSFDDEKSKEINVTTSNPEIALAFEDLINLLEFRGYKLISVSGTPELETNEITEYMFRNFSLDTEIPFIVKYRMKLNPDTLFTNKYQRLHLAINQDDNKEKLNYMLLIGNLATDENSFGGLLLNERNELIYKVDKESTFDAVNEFAYTYIEQFIGEITYTGTSVIDPSIKEMIDKLKN